MNDTHLQWTTVAKDFNSPFCRNYIWTGAFYRQAELFDLPQVKLGIVSRRDNIEYITDMESWTRLHHALRQRVENDSAYLDQLIDVTEEKGKEANIWTHDNIYAIELAGLSDQELYIRLIKGFEYIQTLYVYGTLLVFLDFQGFSFVEGNLKRIIEKYVPPSEYAQYYQLFTAPAHSSFAQVQERDLLQLMTQWYETSGWKEAVLHESATHLKDKYPVFWQELAAHTIRYAWVYYVYAGPAFTSDNFLEFIQEYLAQGVRPKERLKELEYQKGKVQREQELFMSQYQPSTFEHAILHLAGKVVWAKPRRKDYQSCSYYHLEKLQREIGRRLHLSLAQVRSAPFSMLQAALGGSELDVEKISSMQKFHVCIGTSSASVDVLCDDEAGTFSRLVQRDEAQMNKNDIHEIRGATACPGQAKGMVKIINTTADMAKMNHGDVLVSTATTPAIVAAMKKASAIVTDEGGLTCHAAIVSRELNIPCVIGTKCATTVLLDGDTVTVDATNGFVRIARGSSLFGQQ